MRRFLRIRILFVLIALLLVPALALPFAERLRAEWARYWEPEPQIEEGESLEERLAAVERALLLTMRSRQGPNIVPSSFSSLDRVDPTDYPSPVFELPGCRIGELTSAERAERQANFLRAMEQVELAGVPFPDEPPRGYPTADRWEEIKRSRENVRAAQAEP